MISPTVVRSNSGFVEEPLDATPSNLEGCKATLHPQQPTRSHSNPPIAAATPVVSVWLSTVQPQCQTTQSVLAGEVATKPLTVTCLEHQHVRTEYEHHEARHCRQDSTDHAKKDLVPARARKGF